MELVAKESKHTALTNTSAGLASRTLGPGLPSLSVKGPSNMSANMRRMYLLNSAACGVSLKSKRKQ